MLQPEEEFKCKKTQPIKIPQMNTTRIVPTSPTTIKRSYQCSENPFDPSSSPPVSDFMKRLQERKFLYNNVENLSRLTNV